MNPIYPRKLTEPQRTIEQADKLRQKLLRDIRIFKRAGGKVYFAAVGESALPDRPLTYKELSRLEREARLKGAR
jgi:hypothetical protein